MRVGLSVPVDSLVILVIVKGQKIVIRFRLGLLAFGKEQLRASLEDDGDQQKQQKSDADDEKDAARQAEVCEVFVKHAISQLKVTGRMVPQNAP